MQQLLSYLRVYKPTFYLKKKIILISTQISRVRDILLLYALDSL